jgi:hypothetical protein
MYFSEYCYQAKITGTEGTERYFQWKNTVKAIVRNTSDKPRDVLAQLVLISPAKEKTLSKALPVHLNGKKQKEIFFDYDAKLRSPVDKNMLIL